MATISSMVSCFSVNGGRTMVASPEWHPAYSTCSMIPPTYTSVPSQTQSTSISMASVRYLSIRMGWFLETFTAVST